MSGSLVVNIGPNVRRLRERCGLSQVELAARASMVPPQLSDIERGRHTSVTVPVLTRLAIALGCSRDFLLRNIDAEFDRQARGRWVEALRRCELHLRGERIVLTAAFRDLVALTEVDAHLFGPILGDVASELRIRVELFRALTTTAQKRES